MPLNQKNQNRSFETRENVPPVSPEIRKLEIICLERKIYLLNIFSIEFKLNTRLNDRLDVIPCFLANPRIDVVGRVVCIPEIQLSDISSVIITQGSHIISRCRKSRTGPQASRYVDFRTILLALKNNAKIKRESGKFLTEEEDASIVIVLTNFLC